jgi:hypothetical protein
MVILHSYLGEVVREHPLPMPLWVLTATTDIVWRSTKSYMTMLYQLALKFTSTTASMGISKTGKRGTPVVLSKEKNLKLIS